MGRPPSAVVLAGLLVAACSAPQVTKVVLPPAAIVGPVDLAAGIEVMPRYTDGRLDGVALTEIAPGSLADRIGLEGGDVLIELGGVRCVRVHLCRAGARRVEAWIVRRRDFRIVVQRRATRLILEYTHHDPRPL